MIKFYYHLDYFINPSLTSVFEKYFALIISAHRKYSSEQIPMTQLTRTFIGGDDIITLTIPMTSLSDIEKWGHTPMVVMQHYGQDRGLEILENYCKSMQRWESRVTMPYEILTE